MLWSAGRRKLRLDSVSMLWQRVAEALQLTVLLFDQDTCSKYCNVTPMFRERWQRQQSLEVEEGEVMVEAATVRSKEQLATIRKLGLTLPVLPIQASVCNTTTKDVKQILG